MVHRQRVRHPPNGRELDVEQAAIAVLCVRHRRSDHLAVDFPAAGGRQRVSVHRMHHGVAIRTLRDRRHPPQGARVCFAAFPQRSGDAVVPSALSQWHALAFRRASLEHGFVFPGEQESKAQAFALARRLDGTKEVRWPRQIFRRHRHSVGHIRRRRPAPDPTRMQQHCCRRRRPPAERAPRPGAEYLLAFLEKEALLGKERFESGQVHDDVVRFDVAKVRIGGRRHLQVGGRAPEQIDAGVSDDIAVEIVQHRGHVGIDAVLLAQIDAVQHHFLEIRQELRRGEGKRRPRPLFVQVRDGAPGQETHGPVPG